MLPVGSCSFFCDLLPPGSQHSHQGHLRCPAYADPAPSLTARGVPTHRLHLLMSLVKDRGQSIHKLSLLILHPPFHEEDASSTCHICLLQFQSTEHRPSSLDSLKGELPLLSHPSPGFGSSVRPLSLQRPALARSWGVGH